MCFSATASFTSAAVLASAGATAFALNQDPRKRWFVALPLIFGAQQATEGVVWMTLQRGDYGSIHYAAVVAFILIAFAAWPTWMPWAVCQMELNKKRKLWLLSCHAAGLFYTFVALYVIATGKPSAAIEGRCVNYSFENNSATFFPPNLHAFFYFSSTVVPFFISSSRWVKITGMYILSGLIISSLAWKHAVTSVWCFFAALASLYICIHIYREYRVSREIKTQ